MSSDLKLLLRAVFLAAGAGIALAVFSGCATQGIAARKAESLKGWETATLDGTPLMESLRARIALVITNFGSVSVEIEETKLSVQTDRKANGGIGSAIPLTNDGYFLTAAHVIDDADTLHLAVGLSGSQGQTRVEGIPARVVWKSQHAFWRSEDASPGEPPGVKDVAILHAETDSLPGIAPFRLSEKAPQKGDPVIIAGWGLITVVNLPQEGPRLAAGRIVSVVPLDARGTSPGFITVHHDAPVAGGDSGGPLLDRSGKLLGVTSTAPADMFYEGIATATMPDPDWLWKTIENDRLQRNTEANAIPPQLSRSSSK